MSLASKISGDQSSGGLNVTSNNPVPDVNNILVAKLLAEIEGNAKIGTKVFEDLAAEEIKWLGEARKMLSTNIVLYHKFGGKGLEQCSKVAAILKKRAEDKFLSNIFDPHCDKILESEIGGHVGLKAAHVTKKGLVYPDRTDKVAYYQN